MSTEHTPYKPYRLDSSDSKSMEIFSGTEVAAVVATRIFVHISFVDSFMECKNLM